MGVKEQLQLNNQQLEEHRDFIPTMLTAEEARNGQYTWHKYEVSEGKKGKSVGFVVDDNETAYPMDGIHTDGFYYVLYGIPLKVVTWADGTDEEIVEMVKAADKGQINLSDYWAVGQERKVTLSAMSAAGVGESHAEQEVTLVLMNAGGKELASPVESGRTECSFIVGMKNCLSEQGYMNSSATNSGGWQNSKRRTWCNNVFKNAIPQTLLPIFKQFKNLSGKGNDSTSGTTETEDYFALPAEKEMSNNNYYSVPNEGTQFQWYKTSSNRSKNIGDNGSAGGWWLRSPYPSSSDSFAEVYAYGSVSKFVANVDIGISPFGCI